MLRINLEALLEALEVGQSLLTVKFDDRLLLGLDLLPLVPDELPELIYNGAELLWDAQLYSLDVHTARLTSLSGAAIVGGAAEVA